MRLTSAMYEGEVPPPHQQLAAVHSAHHRAAALLYADHQLSQAVSCASGLH